ncbi:MAG: hypothetical protein AVDCRST_MAG68-2793, partial [uncultured Gemmatimonadetes bacterium]
AGPFHAGPPAVRELVGRLGQRAPLRQRPRRHPRRPPRHPPHRPGRRAGTANGGLTQRHRGTEM